MSDVAVDGSSLFVREDVEDDACRSPVLRAEPDFEGIVSEDSDDDDDGDDDDTEVDAEADEATLGVVTDLLVSLSDCVCVVEDDGTSVSLLLVVSFDEFLIESTLLLDGVDDRVAPLLCELDPLSTDLLDLRAGNRAAVLSDGSGVAVVVEDEVITAANVSDD